MANYSYISIPTSRLTKGWLTEHGFSDRREIDTFVCYHATSEVYDHYGSVEDAEVEFICNTQEEFIQKVNESKLMRML